MGLVMEAILKMTSLVIVWFVSMSFMPKDFRYPICPLRAISATPPATSLRVTYSFKTRSMVFNRAADNPLFSGETRSGVVCPIAEMAIADIRTKESRVDLIFIGVGKPRTDTRR